MHWRGRSFQDLLAFPDEARREAGYQLGFVQLGFEAYDWKPMSSIGPGVREIRIHVEGEFRVFYLANYKEAIYVLHAFQKKSRKTSQKDLDIAKTRLRELDRERKL